MKKLVAFFIVALSFCTVNATEKQNASEKHVQTEVYDYSVLTTVQLSVSDIVLPFTIRLFAPSGTVINISGPCKPNIANFYPILI